MTAVPEQERRQLLVLRHAKSDWPSGVPDDARPLASRGERDCVTVGRFLAANELRPDRVVSSPALRARQTVERTLAAARFSAEIDVDARVYEGDLGEVVRAQPPECRRILLVGHQPDLASLIAALTGAEVRLPTATLAAVAVADTWAAQPGLGNQLRLLLPPRLLSRAGV